MQLGAPANDEFNDTLFFDDVIKVFIILSFQKLGVDNNNNNNNIKFQLM